MSDDLKRAKETLDKLLRASFEQGLAQGFTIGKGKPPRPEDIMVLRRVADKVMAATQMTEEALEATK